MACCRCHRRIRYNRSPLRDIRRRIDGDIHGAIALLLERGIVSHMANVILTPTGVEIGRRRFIGRHAVPNVAAHRNAAIDCRQSTPPRRLASISLAWPRFRILHHSMLAWHAQHIKFPRSPIGTPTMR